AFRGPQPDATLDREPTLAELAVVLRDPKVEKINQNIKFDVLSLRANGIPVANVAGDPMLADYLLHAGERSHSIGDLALRYLNHRVIPITDLIGKRGKNQLRMDQVPAARVAEYSGEDADMAWRLCTLLEPKLAEAELAPLYAELEVPPIELLAENDFNVLRNDVPLLERLSQELAVHVR